MGSLSLPAQITKLGLWRFALRLFHRSSVPVEWEGPFHKAGFSDYRIEERVYDRHSKPITPDISSVSLRAFAVVELTTGSESKSTKIARYATVNLSSLANIGLVLPAGNPQAIPIVVRVHEGVPDNCTQVIYGETIKLRDVELITDSSLRDALRHLDGQPRVYAGQIDMAFCSESSLEEIRNGLLDQIKSILITPGKRLSPHDMVMEGLGIASSHISSRAKESLVEKVRTSMDVLARGPRGRLTKYLQYTDGEYSSRLSKRPQGKTLEAIEERLDDWIREARDRTQKTLYQPYSKRLPQNH